MDVSVLNSIPSKLIKGEITKETAVEIIFKFLKDYPQIFGLHKYDEDFKSEVFLILLSKKDRLIPIYRENGEIRTETPLFIGKGDFFYHIYWLVTSAINTRKRALAKNNSKEAALYFESRIQTKEIELKMSKLTVAKENFPKVPVNYTPVTEKDLKKTFSKALQNKKDKKFFVLAMKSCFYLTDELIEKLAAHYKINRNELYDAVQYMKNALESKSEKRNFAMQRRNRSYYYKLNYENQMKNNLEKQDSDEILKNDFLSQKYEMHNKQWKKQNEKLQKNGPYVRPSNKLIANFLGICERQVSYYVSRAKKELENSDFTSENLSEDSEE